MAIERTHAIRERTNFRGAILEGTDLRGVDLSEVEGLTPAQLATAVVDQTTIRPGGWPKITALDALP